MPGHWIVDVVDFFGVLFGELDELCVPDLLLLRERSRSEVVSSLTMIRGTERVNKLGGKTNRLDQLMQYFVSLAKSTLSEFRGFMDPQGLYLDFLSFLLLLSL